MIHIADCKTGNTLAYADFGNPDGFPILIQHGLIASIREQTLFRRLSETGARLISIARPGYGDSAAYAMRNIAEWGELVETVLDKLELDRFDVLGISSGAPYSYALSFRFPKRVRTLFILSGVPALYDENVLSFWPYPVNKNASVVEMQKLAYEIFFAHLSEAERSGDDIRDSMMNACFGVAQDLKLRCIDWGFQLSDVQSRVIMRHSRADMDVPLAAAEITASLLPDCRLEIRENDPHFSQEVLDDFTNTVISANWSQ